MKSISIITKNLKLLLRNRISTLVLTLGPLLVILLVGMAFTSNTISLHMGVYSDSYSALSNEYIAEIESQGYSVTRYELQESCILSVERNVEHACIIFPPNMEVGNDVTNEIVFHVDQSQINLVYVVMSSISDSFTSQSQEVSKDLTNTIITTLFDVRQQVQALDPEVKAIVEDSATISADVSVSKGTLSSLDLNSATGNNDVSVDQISSTIQTLKSDALALVDDGFALADDLYDYDIDGNATVKQAYENDVEAMETLLGDINSTIEEGTNTSIVELDKLAQNLAATVDKLTQKIDNAKSANSQVLDKLDSISTQSAAITSAIGLISEGHENMISKISAVQITNSDSIVSPITTRIEPVAKSNDNLSFIFPSLIVMLLMFIGLMLSSSLVIMEKGSPAHFRTTISPTPAIMFVLGTFITSILLMTLQVIIVSLVSQSYFSVSLTSNLFVLLFISGIMMTLFILTGMLIGHLFTSEEVAMLVSISLATVLLLTSGLIFPLESMPLSIQEKAAYNPMVFGSDLFRQAVLFQTPLSEVKPLLKIALSTIALLVVLLGISMFSDTMQVRKPLFLKKKKKKSVEPVKKVIFSFGNRDAVTLSELIVSLQNTDEQEVLQRKEDIGLWIKQYLKNDELVQHISAKQTKKDIIDALIDTLKRVK